MRAQALLAVVLGAGACSLAFDPDDLSFERPLLPDAGALSPDAGAPSPDAGPLPPDAGPLPPDAGPLPPDAGPLPPDAGPLLPDAGPLLADAGASSPDAGNPDDAGSHANPAADAGVSFACPDGGWCEVTPYFRHAGNVPAELPDALEAVHGVSARDVWVTGQNFQILHWDGSTWYEEARSWGYAYSIWVEPSGEGFAGGTDLGNPARARMLHRSASGAWTPASLPAEAATMTLSGLWARREQGTLVAYAVGGGPHVLRYDGASGLWSVWKTLDFEPDSVLGDLPSGGDLRLFFGGAAMLMADSGPMSAVESQSFRGTKLAGGHPAGVVWGAGGGQIFERVPGPPPAWVDRTTTRDVRTLCVPSGAPGPVRAVASGAGIRRRTGGAWVAEGLPADPAGEMEIFGCWSADSGEAWAVGFRIPRSGGRWPGFVLHIDPDP